MFHGDVKENILFNDKVVRLGEIAADITWHTFLSKVLALKGGTALNPCFGRPQRLSVDLDFSYIGHIERGRMLADCPKVEDVLVRITEQKPTGFKDQQMLLPVEPPVYVELPKIVSGQDKGRGGTGLQSLGLYIPTSISFSHPSH